MSRFGSALARIRRESGFATPYAFYHKNGGRHAFPFTFAYYLKIERGLSLPRAEWLPPLLSLLRIPPTEDLYRRFVLDYLRDMMVTEDAFSALIAPLLCHHVQDRPDKQAAKRLLTEQAYHVTPRQFKALVADPAAYWCFECLVNDRGFHSSADLAETLKLAPAQAEAGLKVLIANRLAKRSKGGKYSSPLASKFYVFPRAYPGFEKDRAKLWKYEEQMARRQGSEIFQGGIMLRAEEGAMRRAVQALSDAMETASAYSVSEKGEQTGLFLLQSRLRRMFPF